MTDFAFDVFLSHNAKDKPRVRRLAERLKAAGLRVWFDEWIIEPGDDIYLAIERGLGVARVQVLCLSQAALESDWVTLERSTVLFRDPTNAGRRFVPVLLTDCQIPDVLRRYRYVDYRDEGDDAFKTLLDACTPNGEQASVSPAVVPPAGPDPPSRQQSDFCRQLFVDFRSKPGVNAAFNMLDDYRSRRIDFGPVGLEGNLRMQEVKTETIIEALAETDPDDHPEEAVYNAIRDCFDAFFDGLELIEIHLRSEMVHFKDVESLLKYWVQQFADVTASRRGEAFVAAARGYVVKYYPDEVQQLAARFGCGFA